MAAQRYYPIYLDLAGKPCLVVGGGTVAEGKVEGLCECAAAVTVISPTVTPRLATLAASGAITILRRPYQTGDVCGYRLVIAATDDRALNARIRPGGAGPRDLGQCGRRPGALRFHRLLGRPPG